MLVDEKTASLITGARKSCLNPRLLVGAHRNCAYLPDAQQMSISD